MNRTTGLALLAEFGPLVAFFTAGRFTDFFTAVAILMVTTAMAVALSWYLDRRIPWLPIVSAVFVLIGGFITLTLRTPDAIILADTLYYGAVASVLGWSIARRKPLLKNLFGTVFALSNEGWRRLTWRWFVFLALAAFANEVARMVLTPESWIEYRFYKSIFVTGFALFQFTLSRHFRLPEVSNKWGIRIKPDAAD